MVILCFCEFSHLILYNTITYHFLYMYHECSYVVKCFITFDNMKTSIMLEIKQILKQKFWWGGVGWEFRLNLTLLLLNTTCPVLANSVDPDQLVPTDLGLLYLSLNIWLSIKNLDQVIWLAGNLKWAWHLNLFSMTRVNTPLSLHITHISPKQILSKAELQQVYILLTLVLLNKLRCQAHF